MSKSKAETPTIDFKDPEYYFNRELSWLEFNDRVLHEAIDSRTPLLERLKFMAIFSSNLDEFYMVRVAGLKQQVEANVNKLTADGRDPSQQLTDISERLRPMICKQDQHFEEVLRGLLAEEKIHLLNYTDLNVEQRTYLQHYYEDHVFPVLTPLAVDPGHPFPYISNLSLNLAVVVQEPSTGDERFARIKVPKVLPRFVQFPKELGIYDEKGKPAIWTGVPLEQIIAHHLETLFPGMTIQECYPFRITRNADIAVEEDEADDLLLAIQKELRKRRMGGSVVRMEIDDSATDQVRGMLMREMKLEESDVHQIQGLLGLGDLMSFMSLPLPELKEPKWTPIVPPPFERYRESENAEGGLSVEEKSESLFGEIRKSDLLVHHPYHSFSATIQELVELAAVDPKVLAIKMTLYRTSGDSPIINALINAAENGKQVAVLVEIKARFDEENNIVWARKLEKSGVHVVYGIVGLKTHTKTTLIVRQEDDKIHRYVHIGTGNYNPKTANLYTDLGLFSCREALGADLTDLFNFLTGHSRQRSYRKLLVAPVSLRDRMIVLIQRERDRAKKGEKARIIAKMNALVDPKIIQNLYEASQAGVEIDLIIRGICCLRPGLKGVSDNIRVVSVIGRFLEHSRIFYFYNQGEEDIYIGSADWMQRNLDRRIEAVVPIDDPNIFQELKEILDLMLSDNRQAWELQPDGHYIQRQPEEDGEVISTHETLMKKALDSSTVT
ncbi:Polyphosphate kinase [Halothece sp. PCC 7418]|uniref:polyphosphate kinase 1 n=1 Tax=Halothece sp. (strain PCC 7418) TaxID=65093 RepID=UPI0002A07299|nr:polyphosphate kinase 1 [Halothece sp. PCC 7418]AFZ43279.1 Polyphosphate kinase [Halothece sp. PCC 7418]